MSSPFVFVTRKFISSMEDFTIFEKSQWLTYLQYENTQIEKKTSNDFFNQKYKDLSGYTDEVWIDTWQFEEVKIIDMYGWTNQVATHFGAIFLENDPSILFLNSKRQLTRIWFEDDESTESKIKKEKDTFQEERSKLYVESYETLCQRKTIKHLEKLSSNCKFSYEDGELLVELPPITPSIIHIKEENPVSRLIVTIPRSKEEELPALKPLCSIQDLMNLSKDYENLHQNYIKYTDEQLAEFQMREEEQWARKREFLHEFNLKSCKFATKMSDMTETEVKLWREYLARDKLIHDGIVDLFDKTEWWDGYHDEIQVMYFEWTRDGKVDLLLDICGWNRAEVGAIYLENEIVYINSDQDICELESTPQELKDRVDAYRHIRIQSCVEELDYDNNHPAHQHCEKIHQKYQNIWNECHPSNYQIMHPDEGFIEQERKYLHEFTLKSCKFATSMSDLTETEVQLWRKFLSRGNFAFPYADTVDFFNNSIYWAAPKEIRIMYFEWTRDGKVDMLVDMNTWPERNDSGAVFLDNQITFIISYRAIYFLETTSQELKDRIHSYSHIRVQRCFETYYGQPAHEYCKQIREKYVNNYI